MTNTKTLKPEDQQSSNLNQKPRALFRVLKIVVPQPSFMLNDSEGRYY